MFRDRDPILNMKNKNAQQPARKVVQNQRKGPNPKRERKSRGDIPSRAPVAFGMNVRMSKPVFQQEAREVVRVRHREQLRGIAGSAGFTLTSFAINPGLSSMFPWLAQIAQNFESYVFRRLDFEFETESPTTAKGAIYMAVDFDAGDDVAINRQQLMSYANAQRSPVWDRFKIVSSKGDLKKFGVQRYIRGGVLAANQDIKTYDVGQLEVATDGCADTSEIGEIYVSYDVDLITPQVNVQSALNNSVNISTAAASRAAPFTGTQTVTGGLPVVASGSTVTFQLPGKYWVDSDIIGTVLTNTSPTITGTANSAVIVGQQYSGAGALEGVERYLVNITEFGQTMIFDYTASATTITSSKIRVAAYGSG